MQNKFGDLLSNAEKLQQRAERARGDAALPAYEKAALAFQAALNETSTSNVDGVIEANFGAGECLQCYADTLTSTCQSLSDDQLTQQIEDETRGKAAEIYNKSIDHYRHVVTPDGNGIRVDAALNCGNVLCSLAEITTGGQEQFQVLEQAELAYKQALSLEEDALTWNNLADAQVQRAESLCSLTKTEEATALFLEAMNAYGRSCQLSSSELGDDLPSLLLSWGSGLLTAAEHCQQHAAAFLKEAQQRLNESISFNRGDPAPYNALGDVLIAESERLLKTGDIQGALQAAGNAIAAGYEGALRIDAQNVDAIIGSAEAETSQAKAFIAANDTEQAVSCYARAAERYGRVIQDLKGWREERSNARYNCACVLVGCGKKEEAVGILRELVKLGTVDVKSIREDDELAPIHGLI